MTTKGTCSDTSENSSQKAENKFPEINFMAVALPTRPLAWSVVTFFVLFLMGMYFNQMFFNDLGGFSTLTLLLVAILSGVIVRFWPRPLFLQKIQLFGETIYGRDRHGHAIELCANEVDLFAVESTFDLNRQSLNPWGRLHVRVGKKWVAIHLHSNEARGCYEAILRRCPNALGLSGEDKIDIPVLQNLTEVVPWAQRIGRAVYHELRRQIAFYLLYAMLFGGYATLGTVGYIARVLAIQRFNFPGITLSTTLICFCTAGSITFLVAAWHRIIFFRKIKHEVSGALERWIVK